MYRMSPRMLDPYNRKPSVMLVRMYSKGPVYKTKMTPDFKSGPPLYILFTHMIGSGYYSKTSLMTTEERM